MSIDPNMLKAMVKEAVNEYFKESYEKRITEEAIKKTINVLIKEGKINTKK
jgi:DNA-directed RNA polymerase subunit E'/Rpb7